jgi:hypothetical protein
MILPEVSTTGLRADWGRDRKRGELLEKLVKASVLTPQEARIHFECMSHAREECSLLDRSYAPEELIPIADLSSFCHLDGNRSCAGCCDNFQQAREILREKYSRRRSAFHAMVIVEEDLERYTQLMAEREPGDGACAFVAFLDDQERSVGCLLHPKNSANEGMDLRKYGKHGLSRCQSYICAGLRTLRKGTFYEWLLLHHLQKASDDWYAYSRLFSPSVSYRYYGGLFEIYLKLVG